MNETSREQRLEDALREIVNPIPYMQKRADEEGAKLDGLWAVSLSTSSVYLKEIAERALR